MLCMAAIHLGHFYTSAFQRTAKYVPPSLCSLKFSCEHKTAKWFQLSSLFPGRQITGPCLFSIVLFSLLFAVHNPLFI